MFHCRGLQAASQFNAKQERSGFERYLQREDDASDLLKAMFASLGGDADQARRDVVFAVLTDGLRPPR